MAKVMAAVDELLKQQSERWIRSLNQLQGEALKLAMAPADGRLSIVFGSHVKPETCV
jgi:hypothetical protein